MQTDLRQESGEATEFWTNKDGKPKNGPNVPVGTEKLDSRLWVREEWETL